MNENTPFPNIYSHPLQLRLFDDTEYSGGRYKDPLADWPLSCVRALAIDPDLEMRLTAAASRWNWDVRLQRVLATDPDQRVVLALLDHVDPYVEVSELIIAGPHEAARRELAGRNVRTTLLERLADDPDPITRATALRALAQRAGLAAEPVVTRR